MINDLLSSAILRSFPLYDSKVGLEFPPPPVILWQFKLCATMRDFVISGYTAVYADIKVVLLQCPPVLHYADQVRILLDSAGCSGAIYRSPHVVHALCIVHSNPVADMCRRQSAGRLNKDALASRTDIGQPRDSYKCQHGSRLRQFSAGCVPAVTRKSQLLKSRCSQNCLITSQSSNYIRLKI